MADTFEIFLAAPPGLEPLLAEEAREHGFQEPKAIAGGVTITGDWSEVWRANLMLRGASRVLVRVSAFRAVHLSQLDKRARQLPWGAFIRDAASVKVEASSKRSRIYHSGAAAERIEKAIHAATGGRRDAKVPVRVFVRIDNNECVVSLDSSGELLHKRGFKQAVSKAPMRETLAALFLRACGYRGGEPVFDPMCGSGTFVIEAAEIAGGLAPGRSRAFAFEQTPAFEPERWAAMRASVEHNTASTPLCFGADRDAGAIEASRANAERAGVANATSFAHQVVSDAKPPTDEPGLVIVNPPYGARIGDRGRLAALYQSLGRTLRARFSGWRVGLITTDTTLARTTGLPFRSPGPPVPHGDLRIRLFQTGPLP